MVDRLGEEAYRRLMRVAFAQGNTAASLQIYPTLQTQLAEVLHITPSPETVALAEHSRMLAAHYKKPLDVMESSPPSQLASPLLGRAKAFRCLVESFQKASARQPQAVLIVGEAGVGENRVAAECMSLGAEQGHTL